jgi:hypothetical protein
VNSLDSLAQGSRGGCEREPDEILSQRAEASSRDGRDAHLGVINPHRSRAPKFRASESAASDTGAWPSGAASESMLDLRQIAPAPGVWPALHPAVLSPLPVPEQSALALANPSIWVVFGFVESQRLRHGGSPTTTTTIAVPTSCAALCTKLGTLTRDHMVAQRLVDAGALRADEMESCPQRHLLTRNLGQGYGVGPDVLELKLVQGDRVLLCSDGLYGGASLGSIRRVLGSREAPTRVARRLIELALRGEAPDNISAIVLAVDHAAAPAAKRRRPSRNQVRRRGEV